MTLHTVLSEPTPHQAEVLAAVCRQAELVIVMTETARRLLVEGGACPADKVRVVPHGAPPVLAQRADAYALAARAGDGALDAQRVRRRRAVPALDVRPDLGRARGSRR